MKKVVLKVHFHDDRIKQKVMKRASGLSGVESVSVNMEEKKLTLSGYVDPVKAVAKLRKLCQTEIDSVGPLKEEKESTNVPIPFYYQMTPPQYSYAYYIRSVQENPKGCVIS